MFSCNKKDHTYTVVRIIEIKLLQNKIVYILFNFSRFLIFHNKCNMTTNCVYICSLLIKQISPTSCSRHCCLYLICHVQTKHFCCQMVVNFKLRLLNIIDNKYYIPVVYQIINVCEFLIYPILNII